VHNTKSRAKKTPADEGAGVKVILNKI